MADFYPQRCGERIPGKPFIPAKPGPQFCGDTVRGSGWRPFSFDVTDACGRPAPFCCPRPFTEFYQSVCYRLADWPDGCVERGQRLVAVLPNGTAAFGVVVDENKAPIPGAIAVPSCPQPCVAAA